MSRTASGLDWRNGRLESREVTRTPDRAQHAGLPVEVEAFGDVRPGEPHEALPEVPVRLVPCFGYCGISSLATDIQRQRVFAVEVMELQCRRHLFDATRSASPLATA